MEELTLDCEQAVRTIESFLIEKLGQARFQRGVLGLSGGVDSSLSAWLAVRALGAGNVTGVIMPYRTSHPQSEADARLVAEQLGLSVLKVDLTPQIDAYFDRFPEADRLRRANKLARERMTILYDQSAALGALVIGTGNKTEGLLGYTTLWGDMACGINPIGALYKTQVRALARHLGLPEQIVAKPPSADLWQGQTDEGELGFTYAEVDRVLWRLVELRRSPEQVVAEGFDAAFVPRVVELMRASEFKRRMPPVARLCGQPLGCDCA